ncbi:MAG: serine/threonine-protein kinase [Caldilineaceae bacterium]|nr:serine/threonine-protein kinase [Caldilineaceae bacterium]
MSTLNCELCGTEYAASLTACPACGVGVAVDFSLPMGAELQGGKFTVGKVLGRGGFGITYKGAHRRLQRPVAIKELFPEFATRSGPRVTVTASRTEGFRREQESVVQEARVIANLNSQSIVDVHDFFHENGTVYIVMEYLEGPTLEQEIERLGQLPPEDVARVADEVCAALDTMHGTNFLHRDVKPANILLARDGRAVLIDFGSAREYEIGKTQSHTRLVTLNYAAPEQLSQTARFGPYTDLFCLGATLYHALTGAPPPPAMDRLQAADQTVKLPSTVPDGLRKAVQGALNCRIEDRPQSVEEFRAFLGGRKAPPVRRSAVPATRTAGGGETHNAVPYEFRGRQYHTPADLVAALAKDWDAAIEEWRNGYIRTWMTRGVVGGTFERTVDRMAGEELFKLEPERQGQLRLARDASFSISETAVQERRLMRVFSIMDPRWKPSYRGMPLVHKEAIGTWCRTHQRAQRSLVHRCLTHGILLVHPKKFARVLHERTFKECEVYGMHIHSHLEAEELATYGHTAELVMFQVFSILVGARTTKELVVQARQDEQAMKVQWFSELVGQAAKSAGCAVALKVLAPKAQQERSRFVGKVWFWVVGLLVMLFMCGIIGSNF